MNQNSLIAIVVATVATGLLTFLGWLVKNSVYGKLEEHEKRIKKNEKDIAMNSNQIQLNTQRDELTIVPLKEIIELKFDKIMGQVTGIQRVIDKIEKRMENIEIRKN